MPPTFLLFLPGIIRQGAGTYHSATGLTVAFSGPVVVAVRGDVRRQRGGLRDPARPGGRPYPLGAAAGSAGDRAGRTGGDAGLRRRGSGPRPPPRTPCTTRPGISRRSGTAWAGTSWPTWRGIRAEKTLLVTGGSATNGPRLRLRLADPASGLGALGRASPPLGLSALRRPARMVAVGGAGRMGGTRGLGKRRAGRRGHGCAGDDQRVRAAGLRHLRGSARRGTRGGHRGRERRGPAAASSGGAAGLPGLAGGPLPCTAAARARTDLVGRSGRAHLREPRR